MLREAPSLQRLESAKHFRTVFPVAMVQIEKKKCRSVKSAMKYQYWCILTFSTVEKLNTLFQDAEKNILELWICIDILFLAAGMQA